ncbi:helix-turn-helix transcriptional regulator [Bradyrhizobium sp. OK095]|uniref:S24 family peptidase n=1 Tax=Bradyrhizobium sp. OK095 TaxID=1882760 RepID=UPI0015A6D18D|nr:helix-turn-helix transcriptional regulator [Bradyrhizobium sp. OK095]
MDVVRKLILEKLADRQLSMKDASLKMGRAHSYLYQFLKKGLPRELHERDRITLAEVLSAPDAIVSPDELRGPSTVQPKRSYEKKSVPSRDGLVDLASHPTHHQSGPSARMVPNAELFGAMMDLPVFGTAQGGADGALIVSELAVDWVARPAVLLRVRDGYGMIIDGDSMSPAHKSGSTALVNPHLPPRMEDVCVFRKHDADGTVHALIKEYRGQTDSEWKVRQYNPPKDFKLKKSEWQVCHRTVGNYFA